MQQKILNNRYELEQKIGEGGMARVYRGRDLRLNRRVAIKVLHSHYATDVGFLQRFHHEAQAAANLRHPNIVDVYDVGQDGDVHYIVMEYIEGSDLKNVILQSAPLPIEQGLAIAANVADGLYAAHRIGMVHRDVKPQNIIIGQGGLVKITDFGIAKSALSTAMTETGVTFGTADYISPEQARGQLATPRSDVYALGVTLYEMLTGRLPFTGENAIAVAMQHVSADPPLPRMFNPRIPPQLETLMLRLLSKQPDERPAHGHECAQLLQRYRDAGEHETVIRPALPRTPGPRPPVQSAPRMPAQSGARLAPQGMTAPRQVLPPHRPAVMAQEPPGSRGLGMGGFILSLLLLAGVLGLVFLFGSGFFNNLFVGSGGPLLRPTATATVEPTAVPTTLPLVTVPDLIGLDEQSARAAVEAAGFLWQIGEPRHSDTMTTGLVLDQFPPPNTPLTQTSVVSYAISLGPSVVILEVPNVKRLPARNARELLEQLGFTVQVREEVSAAVRAGLVTRQIPEEGVRLPRGESVTIIVSLGDKVQMPDVTGLPEEEAKRLIRDAGLVWSFSDFQDCDKLGELCDRYGPGIVVSSEPRGGDLVDRGTPVTLGVRAP